ncbi:hypothetical protein ACH9D2_00720 [Kocuria sp. M4R2S49]|uniref:hypothetical protein n=1 Tax=Kocuria rhizosphaericola TaxID=3376284 RepID=UPI003790E4E5
MTTTGPWIHDLTQGRPGERIEVWDEHHPYHAGAVNEVAAHLGVLWGREAGTGIHQLIPVREHRLRHTSFAQAA